MTKELLEEYKSKKAEIYELEQGLLHINGNDAMMGYSTILNYNSGYPVPEGVVGVDWDKVDRTERRYEKRISLLRQECDEVEEFIESIPDSITRRIFRMRYTDNLSYREIAKKVYMDKKTVAKKIDNFLKVSPKSPNSPL